MAEMAEAVKVAVRVRPLLPKERSDASEECIVCYDSQGVLTIQKEANQERHALMTPAKQRKAATVAAQTGHDGELETLAFDHVWGASSTQEDVFEQVKPLVDGAFNGYNSTVFAYGPSGSGKTHTMMGSADSPGIVPRAIQRVLELAAAQPEQMFVFVLSVLELYNDNFYDLLDESPPLGLSSTKKRRGTSGCSLGSSGAGAAKKIEVVRNGKSSQLRGDYKKLSIDNAKDAVAAVEASMDRRTTSETHLNDRSSRSHCIVILQAQQATAPCARKLADEDSKCRPRASSCGSASGSGCTTIGTLYMVDLAGSERIKQSGVMGDELEEAKHINKSLSALGNVLTQLSDTALTALRLKGKGGVVSYRDSKLTLLLQDALGGNSKTMMITCINSKKESYGNSSVALQYAVRAKAITNVASVNVDAEKKSEIEALKAELEALRRRLDERQVYLDAVDLDEVADLQHKAAQYDGLKQMMLVNEQERQELQQKLSQVINGSALVEQREHEAYHRLHEQLSAHSEKLLTAYRDNEEKQRQIAELQERVDDAARVQAQLEAAREEEAHDKQAHLEARRELERRNRELERRVRELEAAARCASGSARELQTSSACSLDMLSSSSSSLSLSLLDTSHSPAPQQQQQQQQQQPVAPRTPASTHPAAAAAAAAAADSPGEILVRNLDTGETLAAKHVLRSVSTLAVAARIEAARKRLLSPTRIAQAANALRGRAGLSSTAPQAAAQTPAAARHSAFHTHSDTHTLRDLLSPKSLRKRNSARDDNEEEEAEVEHAQTSSPAASLRTSSPAAKRQRRTPSERQREAFSVFSPGSIDKAFRQLDAAAATTTLHHAPAAAAAAAAAVFSPLTRGSTSRIDQAFRQLETQPHSLSLLIPNLTPALPPQPQALLAHTRRHSKDKEGEAPDDASNTRGAGCGWGTQAELSPVDLLSWDPPATGTETGDASESAGTDTSGREHSAADDADASWRKRKREREQEGAGESGSGSGRESGPTRQSLPLSFREMHQSALKGVAERSSWRKSLESVVAWGGSAISNRRQSTSETLSAAENLDPNAPASAGGARGRRSSLRQSLEAAVESVAESRVAHALARTRTARRQSLERAEGAGAGGGGWTRASCSDGAHIPVQDRKSTGSIELVAQENPCTVKLPHDRASLPEGPRRRAERLQQIVTSLSKAKDKTLTHMKRVSGSIV